MNYPIWYIPESGGSLLIAVIAILHVVISHLAVGGGLFLVLTERKAYMENDNALLGYVKSHTWFFLLLTMVFGGVSGVGIWFIIALVNPAATSILIHEFVFGWAIEWVFFIGEIVALLIYHYRWEKMSRKNHMIAGWLYFIFAWLSMVIINGILAFMLTPGKWVETGSFWHGFFNPNYFPSLIFRTSIAIIIAGIFGLITAAFRKDLELRQRIFRYCAKWMYYPLLVLAVSGFFYINVIETESFMNVFHFNPEGHIFLKILIYTSIALFGLGLFTLVRIKGSAQKIIVFVLVAITFAWMGGYEYLREIARKPYVIYGEMYSNGIRPADIPQINEAGFLSVSKWTRVKEITDDNILEAGDEIYRFQCLSCHTNNGYNGVKNKIDKLTMRGIEAQLTGMGKVNTYMPPFAGTEIEKKALAAYLYQELAGKEVIDDEAYTPSELSHEVPPFDIINDDYVLLVWNDLGMHCISDDEKYFSFLPPANTFNAQLVKRGAKPQIITEGISIRYKVEEQHSNPLKHSRFWDYDELTYGVNLEDGVGLAGFGLEGEMNARGDRFAAELIPVLPYRDDGKYNPFPLFGFTATDEAGIKLATTMAVAPTSTEMGCRNCHGGGWAWNNVSGVSHETSQNILAAHDRYNNTTLLADAEAGKPMLCQSCHADPALGAPGKADVLNFSSAIHGFHANYLTGLYGEACNMCHPSTADGNTTCMRGRHADFLDCTNCHGSIEDHALGLLKAEASKEASPRLSANLIPVYVESAEEINPRTPWLMEPDCKGCHTNFNIQNDGWDGTAFNKWAPGFTALYRNRTDNMGMMCISCHGSTHAVYGAYNKYDRHRDNIQPMQYQGLAGTIGTHNNCKICHKKDMSSSGHHRNQVNREFEAALAE
ncbi:MAG: cytochrome ubiquinol oxidase subunit I [Marinilabiliaceae bacterium]|jgi:cytochrome bd-type quinol oxidase subunit 1|nr:cytochrome ubiquinol oxidase subunit I [Marinilabiliaceae bacterium]